MRRKDDVLNDVRTVNIAFTGHLHFECHIYDAIAAVVRHMKALVQSFPVCGEQFKLVGFLKKKENQNLIAFDNHLSSSANTLPSRFSGIVFPVSRLKLAGVQIHRS